MEVLGAEAGDPQMAVFHAVDVPFELTVCMIGAAKEGSAINKRGMPSASILGFHPVEWDF